MKHIVIYGLQRPGRDIFYVGRTNDLRRRLNEHRRFYKGRIEAVILEVVDAAEWRAAEHAWIQEFRDAGLTIANRTEGGDGVEKANAAMLAALAKGRRKHTPDELRRMSAATKGKRKNWSSEGKVRVAENWIKPGTKPWNTFTPDMTEAEKEAIRQRIRAGRTADSYVKMGEAATRGNLAAWSGYTAEQRAARGQGISDGLQSSDALKAHHARRAPQVGAHFRQWWASLSADERADFIARREARRQQTLTSNMNDQTADSGGGISGNPP